MTTVEDLRQLNEQSQARLEAIRHLQELNQHIVRQSHGRLEACRLMLDRRGRRPGVSHEPRGI